MSRRKFARVLAPALAVVLAAAIVVPAVAQQSSAAKATLKTVGGVKFKANRYVQDSMRFNKDAVRIDAGGRLRLVDDTKQPHTLSLVKKSQIPRNMRQMERCFGPGPCDDIAVAHGAVDPETGEEKEPDTPLVNVGKAGFNQPGDSVLIPPNGKTAVNVTAKAGKRLWYLCAIHPWMLGNVKVEPRG